MNLIALNLLAEAGWYSGRKIKDEQLSLWLKESQNSFGCHIFPEAVRILTSYGGLVIGRNMGESALKIEPLVGVFNGDPEGWLWWEWRIQKILFPIASVLYEDITFAVSSDGAIYGIGYGDWFCGANFEDAIVTLCSNTQKVRDFTEEVITSEAMERQEMAERIFAMLQ